MNTHPKRKWTARDLGYFLGRQAALERLVWNEVPLSKAVVQEANKSIAAHKKVFKVSQELKVEGANRMLKWREPFKAFMDEVLAEARQRPYSETSAFFKGFGEGNELKDEDFDNRKVGVNERIAWVMFLFWRPISKFESVAELHRFLSAAAKSMGIKITLKRIEKLCSRIGLRFKGRGRPRKKLIIQTKRLSPA